MADISGSGPISSSEIGDIASARDLAWKWFEYHATQWMAVFRFFILVVAFISTGYVTSALAKEYLLSGVLAVVLIFITFLFYRLDRRSRFLVKVSERYLLIDQNKLSEMLDTSTIEFTKVSDNEKEYKWLCSFSQINKAIFWIVGFFGVIGVLISMQKSGILTLYRDLIHRISL